MLGSHLFAIVVIVAALANAGCARDDFFGQNPTQGTAAFRKLMLKSKIPAGADPVAPQGFGFTSSPSVATAKVDPASGTLVYVAYNTSLMPAVALAELKQAALDFIDSTSGFGVSTGELREAPHFQVTDNRGNITLNFDRYVDGLPVESALLQVVFAPAGDDNYKIREVLNRTFGVIHLSADEKLKDGDANMQQAIGIDALIEQNARQVIFPILENGSYRFKLATKYDLQDAGTGENFTVTVDGDGELVEAYSHRQHAQHQLMVELYDRSYILNTKKAYPLAFATVSGKTTDADGMVDITPGQSYSVSLQGQGSRLSIVSGGSTFNFKTESGSQSVYPLNEQTLAAVNAFVKVNLIADFAAQHLSKNQASVFTSPLSVTVNKNSTCNAYYQNNTLTFFVAGSGSAGNCANTAHVDDVVFHEWGHALDDDVGSRKGITDGAFSEGIGDIVAGYRTGSPVVGPGFFKGKTTGIRTMDNKKVYPKDLRNEVHSDGEIIGAAFWDMRKALIERYGPQSGAFHAEKLFFNHLLTTDSYKNSYEAVLRIDDNDNNPSTKSPNHCLITAAFSAHGLATAESNCVDKFVAFDDSLNLAIRSSQSENVVTFWGAADAKSASIALCLADRESCINSKSKDVLFTKHSDTADGIQIFQSDQAVELKDGAVITILSFDASGEMRAARSAKFSRYLSPGTQ